MLRRSVLMSENQESVVNFENQKDTDRIIMDKSRRKNSKYGKIILILKQI